MKRILFLFILGVGLNLFLVAGNLHSVGVVFRGPTASPAVGDFNGDGELDLAVPLQNFDSIAIALGLGDGFFAPLTSAPVGDLPEVAIAGDFNLDGVPDLAVPNGIDNDVSILLGNGDGTFAPQVRFPVGVFPTGVAAGDLNLNGILDLAIANFSSGDVSILLGKGDGTFLPETRVGSGFTGYNDVDIGDFNEDGSPDLAVANFNSRGVGILLGTGSGSFGPPAFFSVGDRPRTAVLADFNNDLHLDVAIPAGATSFVSVLLGLGNGSFSPPARIPVGVEPIRIVTGDFDANGTQDLASLNQNTEDISILLGTGGGLFAPEIRVKGPRFPRAFSSGDFDGNGLTDLAVGTFGGFQGEGLNVLYSNGNGTFSPFPRSEGFLTAGSGSSFSFLVEDTFREFSGFVNTDGGTGLFLRADGIAISDDGRLLGSVSSDGSLLGFDPLSLVASTIGSSGFEAIPALDFGPKGTAFEGILFGVGRLTDVVTGLVNQFLITIDPATGAGTSIGAPITTLPSIEAIVFTDDGRLFAAGFDPALGAILGEIDPVTGTARRIGSIGFWKVLGLETASDGSLIGAVGPLGFGLRFCGFIRIDPLSGIGSVVGGPGVMGETLPGCFVSLANLAPRTTPLACPGP